MEQAKVCSGDETPLFLPSTLVSGSPFHITDSSAASSHHTVTTTPASCIPPEVGIASHAPHWSASVPSSTRESEHTHDGDQSHPSDFFTAKTHRVARSPKTSLRKYASSPHPSPKTAFMQMYPDDMMECERAMADKVYHDCVPEDVTPMWVHAAMLSPRCPVDTSAWKEKASAFGLDAETVTEVCATPRGGSLGIDPFEVDANLVQKVRKPATAMQSEIAASFPQKSVCVGKSSDLEASKPASGKANNASGDKTSETASEKFVPKEKTSKKKATKAATSGRKAKRSSAYKKSDAKLVLPTSKRKTEKKIPKATTSGRKAKCASVHKTSATKSEKTHVLKEKTSKKQAAKAEMSGRKAKRASVRKKYGAKTTISPTLKQKTSKKKETKAERRGRPPKSVSVYETSGQQVTSPGKEKPSKKPVNKSKRRGRPPKSVSVYETSGQQVTSPGKEKPSKKPVNKAKRRGRPPKSVSVYETSGKKLVTSPGKEKPSKKPVDQAKRRGRPPKFVSVYETSGKKQVTSTGKEKPSKKPLNKASV